MLDLYNIRFQNKINPIDHTPDTISFKNIITMNQKDVHRMFKQDTGTYVPTPPFDESEIPDLEKYIEWLENTLISIYNLP